MRKTVLPTVLLLLLLLGCASGPRAVPQIVSEAQALEPTPAAESEQEAEVTDEDLSAFLDDYSSREYRIGSGDVLRISAPDIEEIEDSYTVGPDGRISLPYVGVVDLQGLTRAEVGERIEKKLEGDYLEPDIDVIVEAYNNNRVFVLGEVRMPGEYNFAGRPTLLGALARAQGLTDNADLRGCAIIRGRGMLIEINLYDLLRRGNRRLNVSLLPQDTVYVKSDEDNTFYVLGEVRHAGAYARTEDVDIVEAISQAGGLTENARTNHVHLIRRSGRDENPLATKYNMGDLLSGQGGARTPKVSKADIVYVPRRRLASFNYILRQLSPSLNMLLLGETLSDRLVTGD